MAFGKCLEIDNMLHILHVLYTFYYYTQYLCHPVVFISIITTFNNRSQHQSQSDNYLVCHQGQQM